MELKVYDATLGYIDASVILSTTTVHVQIFFLGGEKRELII